MKLVVATSQFPVSADVRRNTRYVLRQMRRARSRGAQVIHFCEGALSGYAGSDLASFAGYDWAALEHCTRQVLALARELGLWTLLGSAHRLTAPNKPHNSVYVIDPEGRIVDRYDKRFCAGDVRAETGDLAHYSPGDHVCELTIGGVRCAILICHEYRYPELYRDAKLRGAELIFHSYHAANVPTGRLRAMREQVGFDNHRLNRGTTLPEITMPAAMQAAAAGSHLWISCSNSSARESCWGAFFVRPDGVIIGRLRRNRTGILLTEVDIERPLYDSTAAWRARAMDGVHHSGTVPDDERSRRRTTL